ncbi:MULTISPECIES: DNA sulfur modification protein DndD [Pseudomonas]|uniref:DNA sulfur modification protein DndD n=2 Tax=Gammaproteobacteria TaxID=1236 RepID=UPI000EB2D341|nr:MULTISPECIES: DNA sulfur modification protein DndD [Pseudomonas]MBI8111849.1 DNA sulfur modification protein DndD [Pseudomonas aeruginosa]MBI8241809.1 DNA sulfur modification protein DndD [Pseudomonas aeruginosa]MBI8378409.1 DNA sulfur modification protein DndD [Pseudomonas aeruginosa]MCV0236655.1 DNA sulfur modification protein DndD [Pseudomonas aeruginosa]MDV6731715.1 DNA sulfur modification protein DndD [Pseudomonas aeruginosa]
MAKITINEISIENLGPFREQQSFDLSLQSKRPVILIKALNGSGKTTLLTALQIGLYGYKAINAAKRSEYEQLITGLQRKDAIGPARIEMQLSVEIGDYSQALTIRREWLPKEKGYREQFRVFAGHSEDLALAEDWDDFINGILPVELVHLFLFDGEKIEALANPDRLPALLRRATEVFLGLGGIDALANDLKAVERRANKKSPSGEASEDQQQADEHERQLQELEQGIEMLLQRHAHARTELDNSRRKLENFSVEAQRSGLQAYQQAAELRARVELCEEQHKQARAALVVALEDPLLPLEWLGPLWARYKEQWHLDQQAKNALLLSEEFAKRDRRILELLARHAPQAQSAVADLLATDLESLKAAKQHSPILLPNGNPAEIEPRLQQAKQRLKHAQETVAATQSAMEKAQHAVDQIPAYEQLSAVFEAMQQHTQAVSVAEWQVQELSRELDEARRKQAHFEVRYKAALSRARAELKENVFQLKALEAADRAKIALGVFRDRLLASKAQWLSDMITAEFKQLLRKRNLIARVLVEPQTYAVSIEDMNGHSLPMERLSAGERQILAIAVLSALIRERKGRFPVVVDTPLARLDRKHREALIHNFFARISHQVLVLSTDEEVEGDVHKALEQHMSREYVLTFDDESRRSIASVKAHQLQLETTL